LTQSKVINENGIITFISSDDGSRTLLVRIMCKYYFALRLLINTFSKPFLFADDTKLLKIIKQLSDHSLLQHDLDHLHTWTIHNDLLFSIKKSIQLSFTIKTPTLYSIDSTVLPQLHSHCDLGLILSDDLSWKKHYVHITSKAYKYLWLLRHALVVALLSVRKNTLHYSR